MVLDHHIRDSGIILCEKCGFASVWPGTEYSGETFYGKGICFSMEVGFLMFLHCCDGDGCCWCRVVESVGTSGRDT